MSVLSRWGLRRLNRLLGQFGTAEAFVFRESVYETCLYSVPLAFHIIPMAIRKIARMGHPILGKVAETVADPTAPDVRALVKDMVETMIDADGAGLAAPQVYESRRIVIFQAPPEAAVKPDGEEGYDETAPLTILINPEIEIHTAALENGWEGCLSVPGLRGLVPRPLQLSYSGFDLDGNCIERKARGFHARVVLHECDHLDGILYPQRMTDMANLVFDSEFKHLTAARNDERNKSDAASE